MSNDTTYIIIKASQVFASSFEGIEKILHPTQSPEIAKTKLLEIRKEIKDLTEMCKKITQEGGTIILGEDEDFDNLEDAWDKMLSEKKISYKEWEIGRFGNPRQWCVQKWTGEEFVCCCKELGL